MHVPTGALFTYDEAVTAGAENFVFLEGSAEAVERVSKAVSAQYRAERKSRNRAAKKARRANRGK